jgi:hypothetical protein
MGTATFPGVKRPGVALTTNPHLVPRLKKEFYVLMTVHVDAILGNDQLDALFLNVRVERRVQLYIYSPSGPSWPILG